MPTISSLGSDSPTQLSDKVESTAPSSSGDDESLTEEQGGDEEEEVEEGVVGEEEDEDEEEEEEEEEEVKGGEEDDVEEEEEEEDKQDEECDGDELKESADLLNEEARDNSEKLESEELGGGPNSVSCTHERSNNNPATITHAKGGDVGNLTAYDPSGHNMVGENTRSDRQNDISVDSENVNSGDVVEKAPPLHNNKTDWETPHDSSLSSMRTPHRRSRSSSPGATVENANKRPAIICEFFARGWCIKGNSCRFLHQKEVTNTILQIEGDVAGTIRKGDSLDGTGSKEEAETLKLSTSQELLDSSNTESSQKSPITLQRALVRAYGGENHGLPKSYDDHNMHEANPQSGRESFPAMNEFQQTSVQEEHKRSFCVSPYLDTSDERQSAADDSLSRRYLNEGNLFQQMPRGNSINDLPFSRGFPLAMNTIVPEYIYHSGGSSTAPILYQDSNIPPAYDKKTDDLSIRNQRSYFPPNDSYTSYSFTSSLNSSFISPLQPVRNSTSVHAFALAGTSSTRGSIPLGADHLDSRNMLVCDRGNYGSRSTSLPRNSSPYYSRSEADNIEQHNVQRDLSVFVGQKTQVQDAWAPSVPFRSSFCNTPANMSSSGSQYDPLLDSIEPAITTNTTFQSSERTIIHNVSSQHMNGNPILSGSHTQEYNAQNSLNSFPQAHTGVVAKDTSALGLSGFSAAVPTPGTSTADGGNSSMPKEDKHWIPDHANDGANGYEADPGSNLRSIEGKDRNNKESKALKFFRSALVDFVKELVKPSWREGHLSKDAHKMVVKKAVEKVLSAIQPHQVPSTAESVNQYLSSSRPKILKLVEGYVDKYIKSGVS